MWVLPMGTKFFFVYDSTLIQLPVNPPDLEVNAPGNNKTVETVKLGEVNTLKDKKLTNITIKSFFPASLNAPWVVASGVLAQKPYYYINLFEKIRDNKHTMRLVISDLGVNMEVAIEDFKYGFEAQDDDIHFTLALKEARTATNKNLIFNVDGSLSIANGFEFTRKLTKIIPNSYVIKAGDDLWTIASSVLGSGSKYLDIQKYNRLILGRDPNVLTAGKILKLTGLK